MMAGVEVAEVQKGQQDGVVQRQWRGKFETDYRPEGSFPTAQYKRPIKHTSGWGLGGCEESQSSIIKE